MYAFVSRPVMFSRASRDRIGAMVCSRRLRVHSVSFEDRDAASLIVGSSDGQAPACGAYPFGASGEARLNNDTEGWEGDTSSCGENAVAVEDASKARLTELKMRDGLGMVVGHVPDALCGRG